MSGRGESYQDYYPEFTALAGTYPDDRPQIEQRMRSRIEQISRELIDGPRPAVRMEELMAVLGTGSHPPEEVRRAIESLQPELERRRTAEAEPFREQKRGELEKAQRELTAFQKDETNADVFEAIRVHLERLGWRVETQQDRERVHQQWVERALRVLQRVKELELQPETAAEAWFKSLHRPNGFSRSIDAQAYLTMTPDVRVVEAGGLEQRLYKLAATGRISRQEYQELSRQISRF